MIRLSFLGANQEVTGSNYLLEINNKKIIIDCGLFQGSYFSEEKNHKDFAFNPAEVDSVLLTHAHLDHCGRLPKLVKEGFKGKIFATAPTRDLTEVVLMDSANLIEEESAKYFADFPPLFTTTDVIEAMSLFKDIHYGEKIKINDKISFQFKDAGHILGSSIIELDIKGKTIVFSGDLGNPPVPILRKTEAIKKADYLIIESTYGDRLHEDCGTRKELLKKEIIKTIEKRGVLMIPAFALERTQELLYELNDLIENKKVPQIPVFLDSPMAIKATQIFKRYPEYYNEDAKKLLARHDDFFHFPNLTFTSTVSESKAINKCPNPKIIIAGSGMMHGGRILFHAEHYLSSPSTSLLIVGFQVKGSLGRRLLEGAKKVKIHDRTIMVNSEIRAIGAYSAHADQDQILSWIGGMEQKAQKIFITHGEKESSVALGEKIAEKFKINNLIPQYGDRENLC